MDALIARADAIRPLSELKKGKGRESGSGKAKTKGQVKSKGKAKESSPNDDYTLQSISSHASIPKSLAVLPSDPSSSKNAPKYNHIANKKLRDQLVQQHALNDSLSQTALDTQQGLLALAADNCSWLETAHPAATTPAAVFPLSASWCCICESG